MRCLNCGLIYDDTYGSNTCSCGGEIVSDQEYSAQENTTIRVSDETQKKDETIHEEAVQKRRVNKTIVMIVASTVVLVAAIITSALLLWSRFLVIPNVVNPSLKEKEAIQAIVAAGFEEANIEVNREYSDDIKKGYVIKQSKIDRAYYSSKISLVISRGPDIVVVPNMSGWTEKTVKVELDGKLEYEFGKPIFSDTEKGRVAKQSIEADTKVKRNTKITINLSKGPEMITVPLLTNMTKTEVEALLNNQLIIEYIDDEYNNTIGKDLVVKQDPQANENVPVGSKIIVYLSKEKEEITTTTSTTSTTKPKYVKPQEPRASTIEEENGFSFD